MSLKPVFKGQEYLAGLLININEDFIVLWRML
jgi:hypothetical protein